MSTQHPGRGAPLLEPTHYWGEIEPNLRAIDSWIGAQTDRGQGYGAEMMRLAHAHCFADTAVQAIVVDPLASNTRAIAFYQRLGYVAVERRMFGDDDSLVLRLTRRAWERRRATDADADRASNGGPPGRLREWALRISPNGVDP
jgi:Acetyltransferase (GNAT) domain